MKNEPELTSGVFFSQVDPTDVMGLAWLQAQLVDFDPGLVGFTDFIAALLAHDKMPALVPQPLQQMHRLKATIPDYPDLTVFGQQLLDVFEQFQLSRNRGMAFATPMHAPE
jgi:hypothetical protein